MKRLTRIISVMLVLVMILGIIAGCAPGSKSAGSSTTDTKKSDIPGYLNATGFPIVKQPITITAMVSQDPSQPDWNKIMVWQEYEKKSGIKVEWNSVPSANITEKRNLALASNELPDMFYRAGLGDKDRIKYGNEGTFIELNGLIDKYAPNLKKLIDSMPDVKKGLPSAEGKIYCFPGLSDNIYMELQPKFFLNNTWMQKLNLKMPSTLDDLYNVLMAFKNGDPNGNGRADEIPLSSNSLQNVRDCFYGAFGLLNKAFHHRNVDLDPKTQKLRFVPIAPEFKEYLQYLNKLYVNGLLDKEIFTTTTPAFTAKGEAGIIGSFGYTATTPIGGTHEQEYVGLPASLTGPHGDNIWAAGRSHFSTRNALAITSACKYPEAVVRWQDYFYNEEGSIFYYLGIEGKTFKKDANGELDWLPEIVNNIPAGSSFNNVVSQYSPYTGGSTPTLSTPKWFKGGETQPITKKATENLLPFRPKDIWGPFSWTLNEMDELSQIEGDLNSYTGTMINKFIQGKEPFEGWDNYVNEVKKMKLDQYMKLYQVAYERYIK